MTQSKSVKADFWRGKRVFLTGHTGFKGGWLSFWLTEMGAQVYGYSLAAEPVSKTPSFFHSIQLEDVIEHEVADIRDATKLNASLLEFQPDIVFHLAAQPLVLESYRTPVANFETNVMGTVNILEGCRKLSNLRSLVIITTDKCYKNTGRATPYKEGDPLGGKDPYSASKACAEIVIESYKESFFSSLNSTCVISSARAGNVFGGGDWAPNRIIPDAIRSFFKNEAITLRNPHSIRPWQFVAEPLAAYLILAQETFENAGLGRPWNFGPKSGENLPVSNLIKTFCEIWGETARWNIEPPSTKVPHEEHILTLDCNDAFNILGWKSKLSLAEGLQLTADWYRSFYESPSNVAGLRRLTANQIKIWIS